MGIMKMMQLLAQQKRVLLWGAPSQKHPHPPQQERQREKAAESAERTAAYKRAVSFLLEQQQDLKSGGQKGMHKGRKT